jgi:hypothetical protein
LAGPVSCRSVPRDETRSSRQTATWANSRWTSSPMVLLMPSPSYGFRRRSTGGQTTPYGVLRARGASGRVAGAAKHCGLEAHRTGTACPTCVCSRMPPSRTVAPYSVAWTPWASGRSSVTGGMWPFQAGYHPIEFMLSVSRERLAQRQALGAPRWCCAGRRPGRLTRSAASSRWPTSRRSRPGRALSTWPSCSTA